MFRERPRFFGTIVSLFAGAIIAAAPAAAADYYAGKSIDLIVGGSPGGGIDAYSRMVARHLPRHIPGNPSIVVKNMPGASGTRAAQFVAMVAPADGLAIAATAPGAIVAPLLDDKITSSYNPSRLIYLGTTNVGVSICATMATSAIKTFEDLQTKKSVMGSQSPGSPSYDIAYLVKNLTKAEYSVVPGYKGSAHITLAMERGEIDGICGWNWSGARSQKAEWIRDKKINILAQIAVDENPELTRMGVPPIWKYLKGDDDQKIAKFVLSQKGFERPLLIRDGTPPELVAILRKAFDATMEDPKFLADAEKARLEVSPASGAKVQELVEAFYATPTNIVEKARIAIRP